MSLALIINGKNESREGLQERGFELMNDEPLSYKEAFAFCDEHGKEKECLMNPLSYLGGDVYFKTGEKKE